MGLLTAWRVGTPLLVIRIAESGIGGRAIRDHSFSFEARRSARVQPDFGCRYGGNARKSGIVGCRRPVRPPRLTCQFVDLYFEFRVAERAKASSLSQFFNWAIENRRFRFE